MKGANIWEERDQRLRTDCSHKEKHQVRALNLEGCPTLDTRKTQSTRFPNLTGPTASRAGQEEASCALCWTNEVFLGGLWVRLAMLTPQPLPLPTPRKLLCGNARPCTETCEHGVWRKKNLERTTSKESTCILSRATSKLGPLPHLTPLRSTRGK